MKKYILTLFIISNILLVSAQSKKLNKTIRITYVKAYKNYKDKSKKPPRLMKNLVYMLLCNFNTARFEYVSGMSIDDNTNERFIGKGGGDGVYYKNLKKKIKLHQVDNPLDGKKYLIIEDRNKYDWKLLKESKKILGYTCYKAIAVVKESNPITKKEMKTTVTVWYAPSIPIPFGPAGYDGLPGLVLESSISSFYFVAQKIEFLDKKVSIKVPVKGKKVKETEFIDTMVNKMFKRR